MYVYVRVPSLWVDQHMCEFLVRSSVTILCHCKCWLILSFCGYTGFFPLTLMHVASGCDMLFLGTVFSTSGIKLRWGVGMFWHAEEVWSFFMGVRYHHCQNYERVFIKTNFRYSRTAVYFEKLNRINKTAVFFQTEQSDSKWQVKRNLIHSISLT